MQDVNHLIPDSLSLAHPYKSVQIVLPFKAYLYYVSFCYEIHSSKFVTFSVHDIMWLLLCTLKTFLIFQNFMFLKDIC